MSSRISKLIFLSVLWFVPQSALRSEEKDPAELFPSTTVIYGEIPQPKALIGSVLNHPLRRKLEEVEDYRKAFQSAQFLKFKLVVDIVEQQIGMDWRTAIESLTEGGIYAGVDAATQGVVVVARAKDEAVLTKLRDTLIKLVRDDAARKGEADPIKTTDYRGAFAYRIQEARFATIGRLLIVTNKDDLGKAIVDAYVDGKADSLAANQTFQEIRKSHTEKGGSPDAWTFVNLKVLRDAGVAKPVFAGKADNPAAELLAGGIMLGLQDADFVSGRLQISNEQARFALTLPFRPKSIPESRDYYFGPEGQGKAPPELEVPGKLLSVRTFRDLGGWWNAAPDLLDANEAAKLAQANSGLSTLFSGKDFGIDILGAVRPDWQLIVARQQFDKDATIPDIRLPAAALVLHLKDAEASQRQWKIIFQSLIGFLNVVGAMNGQPPLELSHDTIKDIKVVSAAHLPPEKKDQDKPKPIHYNLSPAIAFFGDTFIISTAKKLAVDAAEASMALPASKSETQVVNTAATLEISALREALSENRGQLVSRSMIEKGQDQAAAEKETDTLLAALGGFRRLGLKLAHDGRALQLELSLELAP